MFYQNTSDNDNRCWNVFAFCLPKFINKPSGKEIIDSIANDSKSYEFSLSPFFQNICTCIETKGWVDIEKEYYDLLRNLIVSPDNCDYAISEINKQLHYIQELLAEYLSSITTDNIKCNAEILRQIYGNIRKDDISISQLQVYYDYVDYLSNKTMCTNSCFVGMVLKVATGTLWQRISNSSESNL